MLDIKQVNKSFSSVLKELDYSVQLKGNNYFFTEKEIHSYFYHLCQNKKEFEYKNTFLIHTEYPTPFKCSIIKNEIKIVEDKEPQKMRAHIDLVLVNPNFLEWIKDKNLEMKYVYALAGKGDYRFEDYILNYRQKYVEFMKETKQSILLYAIEFKFIRHSYDGINTAISNIKQDISKLSSLKRYYIGDCDIPYLQNANSKVYIGERFLSESKKAVLENINKEMCEIIYIKET